MSQVLHDGHAGEHAATLRGLADPAHHAQVGAQRGMSRRRSGSGPRTAGARGSPERSRASWGDLAAPFAPIRLTISPASTVSEILEQGTDPSVVDGHVGKLQHHAIFGHPQVVRRSRPGSPGSPRAEKPSAIFLLNSSTTIRSVAAMTSRMSCSITGPPCTRRRGSCGSTDGGLPSRRGWKEPGLCRLVEAQQFRLGGQRPGDLEATLVAVGQVAGLVRGGQVRDADELAAAALARSTTSRSLPLVAGASCSNAVPARWSWCAARPRPPPRSPARLVSPNSRMF